MAVSTRIVPESSSEQFLMETHNQYNQEDVNDFILNNYLPCPTTGSTLLLPLENQWEDNYIDVSQRLSFFNDSPGSTEFFVKFHDSSTSCHYSKKLNKYYIKRNEVFHVQLKWLPTDRALYLRSVFVYADEKYEAIPVKRCFEHMDLKLSKEYKVEGSHMGHVFRITDNSSYEIDANGFLSSKTTLWPESGAMSVGYLFFCQNSCVSGMNRRATKMVFMIEDDRAAIIATTSLKIHICCNPKRDMKREEARTSPNVLENISFSLSPMLNENIQYNEDDQTAVYSLNINILGEENYKAVCKYAYDLMAAQAFRTGNHQLYKPHMDALLNKEPCYN